MSYNILIVDDSKTVRSMIAKALDIADLPLDQLHQAENGSQALDLLREHWIDLVLTDINMPEMDGMQLVRTMKELLNIVCRQFLTARFGSEPFFSLSLPQAEEVDLSVWQTLAQAWDSVGFMLDEEPLLLRLSLEDKRP